MFRFLLIFICFINFQINFAQIKPYEFKPATDITVSSIGLGSLITSFILHKKKPVLTEEYIKTLDRININKFDKNASYNWNPRAAKLSDGFMYASIVAPLFLLGDNDVRMDMNHATVLYAETFILNTGLTALTKEIIKRKRPYVYNPDAPLDKKLERDATSSFFSGHTSTSASMMFLTARMYSDYNPDSKWTPLVWASAVTIPLGTAILRNKAGKHYWTDVMIGYLVGSSVGLLVPVLHK